MAFNFLGTIPSFEEFEEFEEFIQKEAENIDSRIENLTAEKQRHLELVDKYLAADSRLRAEYKMAGKPDRLWLKEPRPVQVKLNVTLDAANASDVAALKQNFIGAIKQKRERNEFRVKRLRDLAYQIDEEITALEKIKENYEDYLSKIRARFDIDDFTSNQRNKAQDPAELIDGLTETPVDKGIVEINDITYYLVLSINAEYNTITFDGQLPPLQEGDQITLANGLNDGTKTVLSIRNSRTIKVSESVVTETNSKSTAVLVE